MSTGGTSRTTLGAALLASLLASAGAWAGQPIFKRNPPEASATPTTTDAAAAAAVDAIDAGVVAILPPRAAGDVPDGVLSAVEAQLNDAFATTSFTVIAAVDEYGCAFNCARDVGISSGAAFVVDTVVHRAATGFRATISVYDVAADFAQQPQQATFSDDSTMMTALRVVVHRAFGTTAIERQGIDARGMVGASAIIGGIAAVGGGGTAVAVKALAPNNEDAFSTSLFVAAAGALSLFVCGVAWWALPDDGASTP